MERAFLGITDLRIKSVVLGVAVLIYILLGKASYDLSQINDALSENLFLPEGFALACGLMLGILPTWLIICCGQCTLGFIQHLPLFLNGLTTLANGLVMLLGTLCLRLLEFNPSLARSRDYLLMIMVEAVVLQPVVRIFGRLILWLIDPDNQLSWTDVLDFRSFWLLEEATCDIAVTAFVLSLYDFYRHFLKIRYIAELVILLTIATWSCLLLFRADAGWLNLLHIISAAYLGTLLMASRMGMLGAMCGNIILLSFTQYAMHHGHSPLVQLGDAEAQLEFINILVLGVMLSSGVLASLLREREDQAQKLRVLALQDPLTGLYNRRHFYDASERILARLRRHSSQRGALIAIDLDHFKAINDRFGHDSGDRVLSLFADTMRASLRETDIVARLGGEEFAILIEDGDHPGLVTQRISVYLQRELTRQARMPKFTFSAGTTLLSPHDSSIDVCYKRADNALYVAKHQGRNRTVAFENIQAGTDISIRPEDDVPHAKPEDVPVLHGYKSASSKGRHARAVIVPNVSQPHD